MQTYKVKNEKGEEFDVDEDKLSLAENDGFLPVVTKGTEEYRVSSTDLPQAFSDGFNLKGAPIVETPKFSKPEAALKGFASEASMGGIDEASGAVGALTEKALGYIPGVETPSEVDDRLRAEGFNIIDSKGQSTDQSNLVDLYKQYRDTYRKEEDIAKQEQPGAFMAGQVGGLVVPGGAALKGVTGLMKAGKAVDKLSTAKKMAGIGGLSGLLQSEADLTEGEFGQASQDVAAGAAAGLVLGKAADKAGKAVKNFNQENFPGLFRKLEQFNKGFAGTKTYSKEFDEATQLSPAANENIIKPLYDVIDEARAAKETILRESSAVLPKSEILDTLKYNVKQLASGNKEIEAKLNKYVETQFNNQFSDVNQIKPMDLDLFSKVIKDNAPSDETYTNLAKTLSSKINNEVLGDIDDRLKVLNKTISKPMSLLENIIKVDTDDKFTTVSKAADKFVEEVGKDVPTALQSGKIKQVETGFKEIFGEPKAGQYLQGMKKAASERELFSKAKKSAESSPFSPTTDYAFNVAGQVGKQVDQSIPLRKITSGIYKMDKNLANQAINSLSGMDNPNANKVKALLTEYTESSDQIKKNAALFAIAQNPSYRDIMKSVLPFDEENE